MRRFIALSLLGAALLSACAPVSRFEWGAYDQQLFRYHQDPENRDDYMRALERAIERGEETNRVAPGLNAELGYLLWEEGRYAEADARFSREIALFPESRFFIERFISAQAEPSTTVDEQAEDVTSDTPQDDESVS